MLNSQVKFIILLLFYSVYSFGKLSNSLPSIKHLNNEPSVSKVFLVSPYEVISREVKNIPIALWITLDKGWHSYWLHPGDSGKALKVSWDLPSGSFVSHFHWPTPERIELNSVTSFGYKESFLLASVLSLPIKLSTNENEVNVAENKTTQIDIIAQVEWLVCKEVCIPFSQKVNLSLPIKELSQLNTHWKQVFDNWSHKLPQVINNHTVSYEVPLGWDLSVSTQKPYQLLDVFPIKKDDFSNQRPVIKLTGEYQHNFLVKRDQKIKDQTFKALLLLEDKDKQKKGFIYSFKIGQENIFWFLLLAFLGGVLLNGMPCVLPIIFLKFSNTVEATNKKSLDILLSNLFYSLGVILSFILLAVTLLSLKKGGESVGWGFQMQSPYFLIAITLLFVLVSFNFLSLFSISLPSIPFFYRGKGLAKNFLTGVLSTTAASPCTAPFMGAAMGYAFSKSAFQVVLIFFFLGLGLSFPYLLLSFFPRWIKYIPLPGGWSHRLKTFMAFPMLATCIWLIHLLTQQVSNALMPVLFSLLVLGFSFWLLNIVSQKKWLRFILVVTIFASLFYPFFYVYQKREIAQIKWDVFSLEKLDSLKNENKPVFINFTADWCLTCKFNEQITFRSKKVIQFLEQTYNLKGDWTNKNPDITQMLEDYNRSGIPFYIYFPSKKAKPIILPEILTPGIFLRYVKGSDDADADDAPDAPDAPDASVAPDDDFGASGG